MRALKYSSAAVQDLLLSRGDLDINIQNQARESALWYAVRYGNLSAVKTVLEQPNDDSGRSPWDCARRFNRPVMEMIFSNDPMAKVFLGTQSSQDAELPLHQAVSYGSNRNGYTPLHLAIQNKRLEMVNLLLSHPRANVNCKDKDGNTPLWLSTYSSCDGIAERLLAEKDINVNFVGGCGRFETPSTSLHHAASRLDTVLLRRLLAVPGISLNLCVGGHSTISLAAYHGRVNTVACLLSMEGVEINGRDVIDPPICRAVAHGHLDVVRLLVQQGARLNINESTIATHDTALCIAAAGGDLEMVQALLSHDRIDVNIRNQCSEDPLMLAVKGGHSSIVDALLVNPRLKHFSLTKSLNLTRNDCIQRAIRSRMEDANTPQKIAEAVSEEKVWWSVRAGHIYFG
ncbi:hypothetical protein PENARI_c099G05954 [Penicillium arizonense]|uniref:Uncharacterized protein n=1 Tax=Penicillium arizonense TaxID=1835702 RepID=A0A1F5L0X4_PENAI|nr:hypothetical protein PENARI_c099G05954 [Penicillium arizonense]OGE46852.1 hypothetical protein PENARI_c099G05954 [Penicillium arizonense]